MTLLAYRLCDPLVWAIVASGVAVWRLRGRCPEARGRCRFLAAAWISLYLVSLPATAHLFLWLLERQNPPVESRPEGIDSIVILGGGALPPIAGSFSSMLTESTTRRVLRGAELYRDGPPCPIILCGGIVRRDEVDRSEASIMRDLLVLAGIPAEDIVLDETSRNTWENSQSARRILEERSHKRPALVTDASHLPRAVSCFRAQGIDPRPVGCGYCVYTATMHPLAFVPQSTAPLRIYEAMHELMGSASYRLQGRY